VCLRDPTLASPERTALVNFGQAWKTKEAPRGDSNAKRHLGQTTVRRPTFDDRKSSHASALRAFVYLMSDKRILA